MQILFADDDRELCRAARTLLEHEGYAVETVYNGSDALEMAETGSFDGIILDWMMPEMSGISVLSELRRNGITTPCLMLTARAEVEDRVTGLDTGADDYLSKPFTQLNCWLAFARLSAAMKYTRRRPSASVI